MQVRVPSKKNIQLKPKVPKPKNHENQIHINVKFWRFADTYFNK